MSRMLDITVQLLGTSVVAWCGYWGPIYAQEYGEVVCYSLYAGAVIVLLMLASDLQRSVWSG